MCTPKTVSERKCGCVRVCVCVEGSWPMILMHTYIYTVNKFIDRVIGILWPPCLQSFECSRFWRRCVKCGNCVGIRKVIKFCQEESCKIKFSLNQQNFLFCIQLWNFLLNLLNTYVLVGADSYAHVCASLLQLRTGLPLIAVSFTVSPSFAEKSLRHFYISFLLHM